MLAFTYVVEYQKRGLPHAHILLIVAENDRLRNPEDVNAIICAELPPKPSAFGCKKKNVQAGRLHATVLKCMIHGPCGVRNPRSPCMVDGKCSKGYPKTFCKQTSWTQWSSYPSYRRRSTDDGGSTAIVGDFVVDNSWVVPYSPFCLWSMMPILMWKLVFHHLPQSICSCTSIRYFGLLSQFFAVALIAIAHGTKYLTCFLFCRVATELWSN